MAPRARPVEDTESPRPVPELPREVLERLSIHEQGKLFIGDDLARGTDVWFAPLDKQLFLLVARGGHLEARLLEDPRAVLHAEDRGQDWLVRVTGRAVPGRPVPAEPRRAELAHWLPAGVGPARLVAVRFYPESLEYVHGRGGERQRAVGPIPHGAPPPAASRWILLATDGVVGVFFAMALFDWIGLLWLFDEPDRPAILIVLVVLIGALLLAGLQFVHQAARFVRWREGLATDRDAAMLVAGWAAPRRVRLAGFGMMGLGLLLAVLVSLGAGWPVGVLAVLASAVPVLGPYYAARHLLRQKDADTETG